MIWWTALARRRCNLVKAQRRAILSGMGLDGILHATGAAVSSRNVLTNLGTFRVAVPNG